VLIVSYGYFLAEIRMKLSKKDIDTMAEKLTDKLLCTAGLKNAKKIVAQVKYNLVAEYERRKNL